MAISDPVAPSPPPDLATISLNPSAPGGARVFRVSDRRYPSPLFWSRQGTYRFDSPAARWGTCYAGVTLASALQERFSDQIISGRLDYLEVAAQDTFSIGLPVDLKALDLSGPDLTAIRATLQCFVGAYALSQEWGRALMSHPADLEALLYQGRRCGRTCIAMLGDEENRRGFQDKLKVINLGPIVEWDGFWQFAAALRIEWLNAPRLRPTATWSLPA